MTAAAVVRPRLSFLSVNLRGAPGYDPGLQRHHLLPRALVARSCFAALFDNLDPEHVGFDDFRRNGPLLPSCDRAALRLRLPLHRGPHHRHTALVAERISQIEAGWARLSTSPRSTRWPTRCGRRRRTSSRPAWPAARPTPRRIRPPAARLAPPPARPS
ncbi:MAG TPA: AHH domain-containing protein [Novosphingobium sp.]